jgi:hypothetical protein
MILAAGEKLEVSHDGDRSREGRKGMIVIGEGKGG